MGNAVARVSHTPHDAAASSAPPVSGLRGALERALGDPWPEVNRLSHARTSVCFRVTGDDAVTLLLDRRPPIVAPGDQAAEIELELTPQMARQFACGELFTPGALAGGAIVARGPVRQYLEVDRILRSLLARREDQPPSNGGRPAPQGCFTSAATSIPADLLAIETRELEKSFGDHQVLCGTNLTIPEGVISVVLGPSGTGKSVLLQHIIGLLRPDSGDVLIRGQALSGMDRSEVLELRTQIGVMFQDGALFSALDVYDNVAFPLRQHTDLAENAVRELVLERLTAVGLADAAHKLPSALSGGMRKRAGLARALVLAPSIVLCDEPDSGLDPVRTALLGALLAEQHAQMGGTMVVITHNIALAREIGEHISVLWQGRVLESGMRDDVLASKSDFVRQFMAGESAGPLGMDA